MRRFLILLFGFGVLMMLVFSGYAPAEAQPNFQLTAFLTPTPGPDGRILYVVQSGDTLFRIAAVAGLSLNELRELNNFSVDEDVVVPGQIIILGFGGPEVTATSEAGADEAEPVFSPTPEEEGTGTICVLLYNDVNGDSVRQETEVSIGGGEVSVTERTGLFSDTRSTIEDENTLDGTDLTCFEELPIGDYNISVASPSEYNNTTVMNVPLELVPGDTTFLNFGAQFSSQVIIDDTVAGNTNNRSPLLGVIGITLLLAGIGLGIYSMRIKTSG